MKLIVSTVEVRPNNGSNQILEFEGESNDEILSQIDKDEIMSFIEVKEYVKKVGSEAILEEMELDEIKEYLLANE